MEVVALVISLVALLLTLIGLWWSNWWPSRLLIAEPNTYAAVSKDDLLHVELPLVLYNTGARPIVVQNLRLLLQYQNEAPAVLMFNNTLTRLVSNEGRDWAHPFFVAGRMALASVFVFQRKPAGFRFQEGACWAELSMKTKESDGWRRLAKFRLHTPAQAVPLMNSEVLRTYDNAPDGYWGNVA